ncbi:MAG: methyl-accepting chemotaxis protein [Methylovulum sp.]|uniref:methyl-accepting chemotaxis protein n=1 Tax=Methylovulum sp. TaxID=1916980 RepID=UPI002621ED8C|nr:methyl-accepting chemotaxis protein [Methylovulum sp.]MDD2723173.1 methyl-accepting chemotaxis protein [Methylovulum sp.]MDD5124647.1 methyl-accepting chemotaxis protein [Methylovulum sp.]
MKQNKASLFSRLLLWQKFAILGVIAIVLVVLPFGFYLVGAQNGITVTQKEIDGIKPSGNMIKIVQMTQEYRSLASRALGGDKSNIANLELKAKEIDDAIAAMDNLLKKSVRDQATVKNWGIAKEHWQTLAEQVKSHKLTALQALKAQTDLIAEYFVIIDKLADFYLLSFDPEAGSYFMIRSALYAMPQLTETLDKIRSLGTGILMGNKTDTAGTAFLSSFISEAKSHQQESSSQLQKTMALVPNVKTKLQTPMQAAFTAVDNVFKLTETEIIAKESIDYDHKDFFNAYTTAINGVFDLNTQSIVALKQLLEDRKNRLLTELFTVSSGIFFLFVVGAVIAFYVSRSITVPVKHLVSVMRKLSEGDSSVRSNLGNLDEIGVMGRQFDALVDQREMISVTIQKENENLNNSIIELLYAVAKLSQRDLTAKATVAEDVTGPVADALNLLANEMAKVLNRVVQIAHDVADVSGQVQTQAATVINLAADEKQDVEQAALELNEASVAMKDIAKLAFSCNEAAQKAIENTNKAQESVIDTVQGITTIRDTIRETEKRIKRLGERSQEIGGVVNLINEISERTHILALNASMHAASAGEAGRGFAVVANEVQKLAENSREATSKIAALVNNIQVETADTVITMNDAISQVVRGTDLAQQAGNEMRETRDTTSELVQLVKRIAESSTTQSETSLRLVERAQQIQKSTNQTYDQLQEQGRQTDLLVDLSNNLVSSVGVFTLPKTVG